jgi:hypothetical protein
MISKVRVTAGAVCLILAADARSEQATLAEVLAFEPTQAGISVTVPTGGCTKKADFEVNSRQPVPGTAQVEFKRLKPDACKGNFPDGIKLTFSWDDLKLPAGTKLTVANPMAGQAALVKDARPAQVTAHKKLRKRCKRKHRCKTRYKKHYASKYRAKALHAKHHRKYIRHWHSRRCDD